MANVAKIKVNNTTYTVEDSDMREGTTYTTLYSNTTSNVSPITIGPTLYNIFKNLTTAQLARVIVIYYASGYSSSTNNEIFLRCSRDGRNAATPHLLFSAPFAVVDENDEVGNFIYQVSSVSGSTANFIVKTSYDYGGSTPSYTNLSTTDRPFKVIMI